MNPEQLNQPSLPNTKTKLKKKNILLVTLTLFFSVVIATIFTLYPQLFKGLNFLQKNSPLPPLTESAFSIPALIGKNMNDIEQEIGVPIDTLPSSLPENSVTWRRTFRLAKNELVITYNIETNAPETFFLATDDPSGKTTDKSRLLELGNLAENNNAYDVVFVKTAEDPTKFTGVKVIPRKPSSN